MNIHIGVNCVSRCWGIQKLRSGLSLLAHWSVRSDPQTETVGPDPRRDCLAFVAENQCKENCARATDCTERWKVQGKYNEAQVATGLEMLEILTGCVCITLRIAPNLNMAIKTGDGKSSTWKKLSF